MKQNRVRISLLLLVACAFALSFISKPKVKHLIGTWEIYKVQKKNKSPKENREKFLQFDEDGTIQGGSIGDAPSKNGTWTLDDTNLILTLNTAEGNKDDGEYSIVKLNKREMILLKNAYTIFFEKIK